MDAKLIGLLTSSDDEALAAVTMELYEMGYEVITDNANYVFGIPGTDSITPIMFMAHIDTCCKPGYPIIPGVFFDTLYNVNGAKCGCLGADDRAGVYICLEIAGRLESKPYILFTTGEEIGHVGVKAFLGAQHPERTSVPEEFYSGKTIIEPYLEDIYAILQYDRQGFNSVVAYGAARLQYDLINKAVLLGYYHDSGTTSDSRNITEMHGVAHLNLSAGFLHQHTKEELLLLPALDFAINNGIILAQMIDIPYRVSKPDLFSGWPIMGYSKYPPRAEDKPLPDDTGLVPECDVCGKQRTVYYLEHADALVCKKCIRRAGGEDKITYNNLSEHKDKLASQRLLSKQNNLPFIPSCPIDKSHQDIYPLAHNIMFCDECGTYFWQIPEGVYWWKCVDSTTATFEYYDKNLGQIDVSSTEDMCPLDNCEMCGKLLPDKYLSYYTNQETHETTLVVCDECNAIDPPRKRGRG